MSGRPEPSADLVASIFIDVVPQRVWDEITKTGRVQLAVVNTVLDTELKPGAKLRYYSADRKRVFVVGEVIAVEPPQRFVHTYWFTTWKKGTPTVVTWDLRPEGEGCRVTITHSGWTAAHEARADTRGGWGKILAALKQVLETGKIPFRTRLAYALMRWFAFLLPKSTRAEYADRMGW